MMDRVSNRKAAVTKEAANSRASKPTTRDPYEGRTPYKVEETDDLIVEYYDIEPTPEQLEAWRQLWRLLFQRVFSKPND